MINYPAHLEESRTLFVVTWSAAHSSKIVPEQVWTYLIVITCKIYVLCSCQNVEWLLYLLPNQLILCPWLFYWKFHFLFCALVYREGKIKMKKNEYYNISRVLFVLKYIKHICNIYNTFIQIILLRFQCNFSVITC